MVPPTKTNARLAHSELDLNAVQDEYRAWLVRQPLAAKTRTTYQRRVGEYLTWLASQDPRPAVFVDPIVRDHSMRDFKTYLKIERKAAPASVNLALAPGTTSTGSSTSAPQTFAANAYPKLHPRPWTVKNRNGCFALWSNAAPNEIAQSDICFCTPGYGSVNCTPSPSTTCPSPHAKAK
jgi:hypothetical protein